MATVKETKRLASQLNARAFFAREIGYAAFAVQLMAICNQLMGWVDTGRKQPPAPPQPPPRWVQPKR